MGEVYSVGFDLSALEKALKMSLQIKKNLSGLGSVESSKGLNYKKMSNSFKDTLKNDPYEKLNKSFKSIKTGDFSKEFKELEKTFEKLSKNDFSKSFTELNKAFDELKNSKELENFKNTFKELKNSPAFKKLDKAFKVFNKDLNKGNKQLKEQNKLLSKNLQTMKLMRMVGGGLKMGLGALGIGAGIGGLVSALTKPYSGNLSTNLRAKNIGLSVQEHDALGFAGKMTGLGEDTLISAIEGLTTAIEDPNVWTHFASLGLNAEDLQKKNPTEAFFDVLKSMKNSKLPNHIIKETIDSIGIPFDNFRFILKEGTGELEKFFNEGKKLNKDNDKYAKGVWKLNKETGKWEQVHEGLIDAERETIRFMENFGGTMKHISYDIAPPYIDGLKSITGLLPTLETTLSKTITWGLDFMKGLAETPEEDRATYFYNQLTKPLMDAIGGAFQKGIDSLMDSFKEQFKPLFDFFDEVKEKGIVGAIIGDGKELEADDDIRQHFTETKTGLNSYANSFYALAEGDMGALDDLMEGFRLKELTKKESQMLYNTYLGEKKAKEYGFTKEDFFDNYEQKQVNDAIITPNNQLITTNPKDYIFAMKRPQDLATTESSGGNNYTITINNPVVKDDKDIRKLKTELERLIRSFNSKR